MVSGLLMGGGGLGAGLGWFPPFTGKAESVAQPGDFGFHTCQATLLGTSLHLSLPVGDAQQEPGALSNTLDWGTEHQRGTWPPLLGSSP